MTAAAWAVLVVALAIAALDWISVAATIRRLEYATKPGFILALILLAIVLRPIDQAERAFFIVALAVGLSREHSAVPPRSGTPGRVAGQLADFGDVQAVEGLFVDELEKLKRLATVV